MGFGTGFDMRVYQKLLIVTIVALKAVHHSNLSWDNSLENNKKRWIRPVTKSSQTQNSNRNKQNTQRHLEPGAPNIRPR